MKRAFLLLTMLCLATVAWADDQTQAVQQALKDQGFYYGTVDGQGGPETDAAVRRYQIRQGLDVTGKLDAQTLSSLNLGGSANDGNNTLQAVPAPPADSADAQPAQQQATPPPQVVQSDNDFLRHQVQAATPAPAPDDEAAPPPAERVEPAEPVQPQEPAQPPESAPYEGQTVPSEYSDFFRKTPYETAPPVVQRGTVQQAQQRLGREGFYRGIADGELSKSLSHALANYQQEENLKVSGRLDMETLDDLNLLPRRRVVVGPPVPFVVRRGPPVIYPGIWVH